MRVYVLLTLIVTGTTFSPTAAAQGLDPTETITKSVEDYRRVRTHDPRLREALAQGAARSAAFREVLHRVETGDVIVYIEMQMSLRGRLAGQMRWVAATAQARYVRVAINPQLSGPQLVATLAHELQHVAEIASAPSVVNERTLSAFYRGVGKERRADSDAWDTEAAQLTGEVVRRELAAHVAVDRASILLSRMLAGGQ
jgi:hypothetical protein